jgi:hypothetical protein
LSRGRGSKAQRKRDCKRETAARGVVDLLSHRVPHGPAADRLEDRQAVGQRIRFEVGQGVDGVVLVVDQLLGQVGHARPVYDGIVVAHNRQCGQVLGQGSEALLVEVNGFRLDPKVRLQGQERIGPGTPFQGGKRFLYVRFPQKNASTI